MTHRYQCQKFCSEFQERMRAAKNPNRRLFYCSECCRFVHQDMVYQFHCACCGRLVRAKKETGKPGRPRKEAGVLAPA